MKQQKFDIIIISVLYLSIALNFYYTGINRYTELSSFPLIVNIIPFVASFLELIRIIFWKGKRKWSYVGKPWIYIFIMYMFSFVWGYLNGITHIYSNVFVFVICIPIAWLYFSLVLQNNHFLISFLIKINFWLLIYWSVFSIIFLFSYASFTGSGLSQINSGYYSLLSYPICMLDKSKFKRIIATLLMVAVVLLTMKRGGIMALIFGISLYFIFSDRFFIKKLLLGILFLGSFSLAVIVVNDVSNGALFESFRFVNDDQEEARVGIFKSVWDNSRSSSIPNLFLGHGHKAVTENHIASDMAAHNDYLEFLYDYGLVGLFLLLLYQFRLYKVTKMSRKYNIAFFPTIFAFSCIFALSSVSVLYSFQYFMLLIPFWNIMNERTKKSTWPYVNTYN